MIDGHALWKLFRPFVPEKSRKKTFEKFLEILFDDGWDQGGYMHEWPASWREVHEFCREHECE